MLVVDDRGGAGDPLKRALRKIPAAAEVDACLLHVDEGLVGRVADSRNAYRQRSQFDRSGRFFLVTTHKSIFRFQLANSDAHEPIVADE